MDFKDVIGKKIVDIRFEIKDFVYNGSIPLEESSSSIILNTGEIFEIPSISQNTIFSIDSISQKQQTIFEKKSRNSFFSNFFKLNSFYNEIIKRNTLNIKDKKITAFYKYKTGYSEKDREWNKYIIEVESGFLISEYELSPKGTASTGIWIFSSKKDLANKIGRGFSKKK